MATKKSSSIQQLLQAEQEATEIVKEAKKQRLLKLKEAKDEAEKELQKFRQDKEKYFQKFVKEQIEAGGSNTALQQKKNQIINNIQQNAQMKKAAVVGYLVDNVIGNINVDLEKEQKAFIEKRSK